EDDKVDGSKQSKRILRRTPVGSGLFCPGTTTTIVDVSGMASRYIRAVAVSEPLLAWVEQDASGPSIYSVVVLDLGKGTQAVVNNGGAGTSNLIVSSSLQIAGGYVAWLEELPGGYQWQVVKIDNPSSVFPFPGTPTVQNATSLSLAADGTKLLLANVGSSSTQGVLTVRVPGADGSYVSGKETTREFTLQSTIGAWSTGFDGAHAVAVPYAYSANPVPIYDWYAGPDNQFGTNGFGANDDVFTSVLPSTAYRSDVALSEGLLIYAMGSVYTDPNADLFSLDLTTMRWESVDARSLYAPTLNGFGTMFYTDFESTSGTTSYRIFARSPGGVETSARIDPLAIGNTKRHYAATGRDLVAFNSVGPGPYWMYVFQPDATGTWFTQSAPNPIQLLKVGAFSATDTSFGTPEAGDGKALISTRGGAPDYYYHPYVIEPTPNLGEPADTDCLAYPARCSLANTVCPGPRCVDITSASCQPSVREPSGGISRHYAAWLGVVPPWADPLSSPVQVFYYSAGADGAFGTADDSPAVPLTDPRCTGVCTARIARVGGSSIGFYDGASLIVVTNPGTAGARSTTVPLPGAVVDFAMAGDYVAYTTVNLNGVQAQTFNIATGASIVWSSHYSPKGAIAVDPSGRIAWEDQFFSTQSIFSATR
ncbi:MAG: hypothetical protein HY901_18105, partial [Deltaproteobacteria bacterium]|nr:hypothetical protein [Deltaproteobacteria bacterium]